MDLEQRAQKKQMYLEHIANFTWHRVQTHILSSPKKIKTIVHNQTKE